LIDVDAVPRRTSWLNAPRGNRVARAIFRIGVTIWATAVIGALMAMMIGALWLLVALARGI
jgi:hypothetical protein